MDDGLAALVITVVVKEAAPFMVHLLLRFTMEVAPMALGGMKIAESLLTFMGQWVRARHLYRVNGSGMYSDNWSLDSAGMSVEFSSYPISSGLRQISMG